jgi:alpha-L-fucosidase 2
LPANLQGIWADGLNPPWDADYHININIQMNYWPAETTNLSELHRPFLDFIRDLVPDGQKTARDMYGLPGAVAHFTTDAWKFTETYGQPQWALWPMGLAGVLSISGSITCSPATGITCRRKATRY